MQLKSAFRQKGVHPSFAKPSLIVLSALALLAEPRRLDTRLSDAHFIEPLVLVLDACLSQVPSQVVGKSKKTKAHPVERRG